MAVKYTTRHGDVFEQTTDEGYTDEKFIGTIHEFSSETLKIMGLTQIAKFVRRSLNSK